MEMPSTKKRIKILYIITKSNLGGAQRYVFDLATSLSPLEYDVLVAFGEGGVLEDRLKEAHIKTVRITSLQRDISITKDLKIFFELIRLFRKFRPDVIHLNSSKIGGVGGLAGRVCRVPNIIFTGHGWAFNEERSSVSRFLISLAHWATILLSHKTIAVSEKTAEQIQKLPGVKDKIVVIHNGISSAHFEERNAARHILATHHPFLKTHHKDIEKGLWIGTTSELHKNKGLDIAIEAFAEIGHKYPEICFVIMGEGDERKNLEALIKKLKLEQQVFLLGFVPDGRKYLKAFDIFTLTSRTEAFPYSIMDAGLAKLPVIASDVGGIPEMISNNISGILVPPKDIQAVRDAFFGLTHDLGKQESLGNKLYEKISAEFLLQYMFSKTIALYTKKQSEESSTHEHQ